MGEAGGGGGHPGEQAQRVARVATKVEVVTHHVGVTGGPAGGCPAEVVGEAGLVAEALGAQAGAVEAVESELGGAGPGGVGGGGALDLGVVGEQAQTGQTGVGGGVLAAGHHPVAVARISRQHPTRVAITGDQVFPPVDVGEGGRGGDGHLGNEVKGPVGSRAAAVEVVGLVLVGPGGVGLPAQAELAL
ncbi:hypothetical protein FH603_5967, partial [Spirosoma sp. LMG 31447]|nr:hypothetical protein [Spirosoma utsteinense]